MDEVIAFIQSKEGAHNTLANYERTTTQWWTNPISSFPDKYECPIMTRQTATGGESVDVKLHLDVDAPEYSTVVASDIPASGAGADKEADPLTIRKYKRAYLLKGDFSYEQDVQRIQGWSGIFTVRRDAYITFKAYEGVGEVSIGYWNATLDGWVIPPKNKALIEEMMEAKAKED